MVVLMKKATGIIALITVTALNNNFQKNFSKVAFAMSPSVS